MNSSLRLSWLLYSGLIVTIVFGLILTGCGNSGKKQEGTEIPRTYYPNMSETQYQPPPPNNIRPPNSIRSEEDLLSAIIEYLDRKPAPTRRHRHRFPLADQFPVYFPRGWRPGDFLHPPPPVAIAPATSTSVPASAPSAPTPTCEVRIVVIDRNTGNVGPASTSVSVVDPIQHVLVAISSNGTLGKNLLRMSIDLPISRGNGMETLHDIQVGDGQVFGPLMPVSCPSGPSSCVVTNSYVWGVVESNGQIIARCSGAINRTY